MICEPNTNPDRNFVVNFVANTTGYNDGLIRLVNFDGPGLLFLATPVVVLETVKPQKLTCSQHNSTQ